MSRYLCWKTIWDKLLFKVFYVLLKSCLDGIFKCVANKININQLVSQLKSFFFNYYSFFNTVSSSKTYSIGMISNHSTRINHSFLLYRLHTYCRYIWFFKTSLDKAWQTSTLRTNAHSIFSTLFTIQVWILKIHIYHKLQFLTVITKKKEKQKQKQDYISTKFMAHSASSIL